MEIIDMYIRYVDNESENKILQFKLHSILQGGTIFKQRLAELSVASFEPPDTGMDNDFEKKNSKDGQGRFQKNWKKLKSYKKRVYLP